MRVLQIILLCGITICSIQMASAQQPVAEINGNSIIGQKVKFSSYEANQYLGVPYAEPPVGPLRFQKPQPLQNSPSEYEAFNNPSACVQYTTIPYPWYVNVNTTNQSEDCLCLNIWTPANATSGDKKAVMFWIHGGGYRYGSINDPTYNGTRLATLGDIIVVTVNYRVGYFGFFTSNSSDAPGNLGIWDVLEGLKWVNKNIAAFGGDPTRITIAGESSGAVTVGILSTSPLAKGLFARQILQTTSPVNRRADNNTANLAFSRQLSEYFGCANDTCTIDNHPKEIVQCLQGIDAEKISKADYDLTKLAGYHLLPQYGDEILSNDPRVSIVNGDFSCTDTLLGDNVDVGSYYMTTFEYQDYFGFHGEKDPHVNRSLGEEIIRKRLSTFPDIDAIVNQYLPPNLTDDADYQIRTNTYQALGDMGYLCPIIFYAEKCAEQNKNVYTYYFSHRPNNSPWAPWMGTTVYDEVAFVFGNTIANSENSYEEYQLSEEIISLWTSFVRNGKPDDSWPLYSKENRIYRILGNVLGTDEYATGGPHTQSCLFLKPQFGF